MKTDTALRMTGPTGGGVQRQTLTPPSYLEACALVVRRNLIHIRRMPELLMDVTVQPVMFVLLFAYVFGSSIDVPGSNYREFLVPGIMAQTIVFSSFIVAMGLVSDLEKGFVDRLKSLPIPRSSILVGRSLSSLIHSSIGVTVMALTGLIIGWRMRNGLGDAVLAFVLLLAVGFAMIWVGILAGSCFRTVEGVQGFMFTVMFPVTFLANTFTPPSGCPSGCASWRSGTPSRHWPKRPGSCGATGRWRHRTRPFPCTIRWSRLWCGRCFSRR